MMITVMSSSPAATGQAHIEQFQSQIYLVCKLLDALFYLPLPHQKTTRTTRIAKGDDTRKANKPTREQDS